jgi:ribonuclease HI
MITIYTDGAAKGNPGRGGYGVVLLSPEHGARKELSAGYEFTTNNRMELLAVIVGLEALRKPNSDVIIYSDSQYVVNSVEKGWIWGWLKKGFAGKKNADLWRRFIAVYKQHQVKLQWIKGHANIPENERCDKLSVDAANSNNLLIDEGYEQDKS